MKWLILNVIMIKEQVVVPLENILAHIENHLSGGHEHE